MNRRIHRDRRSQFGALDATCPDVSVLDPGTLSSLENDCGSDLPDFIAQFLAETAERITRVGTQFRSGDTIGLHREIHTMKGASLTYGCRAIADQAEAIEMAVNPTTADLDGLIRELKLTFERTTAELCRRYPALASCLL